MRFPQPRFVQNWLFALSRLQCGQIGVGNGTNSSVSERIRPRHRWKRKWLASCTGSSTPRLVSITEPMLTINCRANKFVPHSLVQGQLLHPQIADLANVEGIFVAAVNGIYGSELL
jgi:hypothetical protein